MAATPRALFMIHAFMDAVSRSPLYGRFIRARPEAGVALWAALQPCYTVYLAHDLHVRTHHTLWKTMPPPDVTSEAWPDV